MNYGLPPAYSSTSQPSQNRLPDSHQETARATASDPEAWTFVARGSRRDRFSNTPDIRRRRATAHRAPSSRRPPPLTKKKSPEGAKEKIDEAYVELKNQCFTDAEKKFQAILQEYRNQLSHTDRNNTVIGLARSLKEQTPEKQENARRRLEEIRLSEPLNAFGASYIPNLDLTLSRCEQALGHFAEAEKRLIRLRNKKLDADEEILCQTSHNFDADITNARAWQSMGKHQMTETLLVNMKNELTTKLQSNQHNATAEKLQERLHTVNIALVRLLQEKGLYEWAEDLLLNISDKQPNDNEEFLCKPCGDGETDLALARLWKVMKKYELSEKLLLNMSDKHLDKSEQMLCARTHNRNIDLALARLWQIMEKHELTEKLLLSISGKHHNASEEMLCKPCWHFDTDLALAMHWQIMGKYHLAERLLLNMSKKHLNNPVEYLCEPSGIRDLDIALVRLWEAMCKFELSERLLLSMNNMDPGDNEEILCQPSGNHEIDLGRVRLWQLMGKPKLTGRLLFNLSNKHPNDTEDKLCKPCGLYFIDLALVRYLETDGKPALAEKLLLNMMGMDPNDEEDTLCQPCGDHDIDLTRVRLWQGMDKHEQAEKLLDRCSELYHSKVFEFALLSIQAGKTGFMEMLARHPESVETLLATSLHYFTLARQQIKDKTPEAGADNLKKALECVETAMKNYPPNAGAYSQKAHCLRMMGVDKQIWSALFEKADALDPSRPHRDKTDIWRRDESIALQKVLAQLNEDPHGADSVGQGSENWFLGPGID